MAARLDKEPQQTFSFKDRTGNYEMPLKLKELYDFLVRKYEGIGYLKVYLWTLFQVSSAQQAEYKGTAYVPLVPTVQEGQDPVEVSTVIEGVSSNYEGSRGMKNFVDARNGLIETVGLENIRKLEAFLGLDSTSVETGDSRPLLGVDKAIVRAFSHYVTPEN